MWSGPIHDPEFVAKVLTHLEGNQDHYGTAARMKGMLTVAQEVSEATRDWKRTEYFPGTRYTVLLYSIEGGQFFPLSNTIS